MRRPAPLLVMASLVALAACGGDTTRAEPAGARAVPPSTQVGPAPTKDVALGPPPSFTEPPWQAAAHAAAEIGYKAPDGFGGIFVNQDAQTADIYVVRGFGALADQLLDVARPYGRVLWVERPYAVLMAARDEIARDIDWIHGIGLYPSTWGPDERSNTVFVNVPAVTPAQAQAVKARFGSFVELHVVDEQIHFS